MVAIVISILEKGLESLPSDFQDLFKLVTNKVVKRLICYRILHKAT